MKVLGDVTDGFRRYDEEAVDPIQTRVRNHYYM